MYSLLFLEDRVGRQYLQVGHIVPLLEKWIVHFGGCAYLEEYESDERNRARSVFTGYACQEL